MNAAALVSLAAIAAPTLLDEAATHGYVLVEPYVSEAQRAAAAAVQGTILGVAPRSYTERETRAGLPLRTTHHLLRVLEVLRATRGASPSPVRRNFARLTPEDGEALCGAFLAACSAGVRTDSRPAYAIVVDGDDEAAFSKLDAGGAELDDLTSLGVAVKRVVTERARAGWAAAQEDPSEFDADACQAAVVHLVTEMDARGYSALGDPRRYDVIGVGEALSQSFEWLSGKAAGAAGAVAGLVGDAASAVLFSSPVMLLAIGAILYKRLR